MSCLPLTVQKHFIYFVVVVVFVVNRVTTRLLINQEDYKRTNLSSASFPLSVNENSALQIS